MSTFFLPDISLVSLDNLIDVVSDIDKEISFLEKEEMIYLKANDNKLNTGFESSPIVECISQKLQLLCYKKRVCDKFDVRIFNAEDLY